MWRINIVYIDNSEVSFKGNTTDISLEDAFYYYNNYVKGRMCTATFQKYPIKENPKTELEDKIIALQKEASESLHKQTSNGLSFEPGNVFTYHIDVYMKQGITPEYMQSNILELCRNAGINVLHSDIRDNVTAEYEDLYPSISHEKILETADAIFYRHSTKKEDNIMIFSKICHQISTGPDCNTRLQATLQAISNGIIEPSFISENI